MENQQRVFLTFYAIGERGHGIDVYSIETRELLFPMSNYESLADVGFSIDGRYVVGKRESGYVIGDLLTDEEELLSYTRRFVRGD